jgi:hypothetical protein
MSSPSSPPASKALGPADFEQIVAEVARRHGLLLDRSDPVLITVTLGELMRARVVAQIEEAAGAARLEIAAGAARQTEAVKAEAAQLITAAADYADEQFRLAARAAAENLRSGILQQLAELPAIVDVDRLARTASYVRWAAAFVYLTATLTAALVIVLPLVSLSSPVTASCPWPQEQATQR